MLEPQGRYPLEDDAFRAQFLALIAAGYGKHEACEKVGISPSTFRTMWKRSTDFREEYDDARDAATEPVLKALREGAEQGDVAAAKEYLKHTAAPPRGDGAGAKAELEITHKHEIDPKDIQDINELLARVRDRQAELPSPDYIEADIVEDAETTDG